MAQNISVFIAAIVAKIEKLPKIRLGRSLHTASISNHNSSTTAIIRETYPRYCR